MDRDKSINMKKYKAKRGLNVGTVLFAAVLIYLVANIILSLTSKKLNTYEVREGSILKDNSYTGLALRQETVIPCSGDGFINFYENNGSTLRYGAKTYAITSEQINYDTGSENDVKELSAKEKEDLVMHIQNFNETYSSQKFSAVYALENEIDNIIYKSASQTKNSQLDSYISGNNISADSYSSDQNGIMGYTVDGYESVTPDTIDKSHFDASNYNPITRKDNDHVLSGDPAYKLVTSEKWYIMIPLTKETAKELKDKTVIKTRLNKENINIWADFSIDKINGDYYGKLEYNNSLIRFVNDRFIHVELIIEDESGLKIPKNAVLEKECYEIPESYMTIGGNSEKTGVLVRGRNDNVKFKEVPIIKVGEDGNVYVGTDQFEDSAVILIPDSSERYILKNKKPVKGVYNVNKGYAEFIQITILCESDDYYIVKEADAYGLHNYDQIAQEADSIKEGEIIF